MNEDTRAQYLEALGIEQWHPRAAEAQPPAAAEQPEVAAAAHEAAPQAAPHATAPQALPTVPELYTPDVEKLLNQASVTWTQAPQAHTRLAVVGIDASGAALQATGFEAETEVLGKMIAAIKEDISNCALGGLSWGNNGGERLSAPFTLLLVDSPQDVQSIAFWDGKLLNVQGSATVIAPHPRMFSVEPSLKRQAWHALQQLQALWSD